ncbi:MAG: hypothetical protein IKJ63_03525 [Clostridia bacterium]|nr:hypothetical protein [Clostridia bacterium]
MADKCSICGGKSDNLCFNYESHRIPCICKECKDVCERLIDSKMPRSKKTEAINILESYITNNPDMALFVKGILRMSIANAFIQKKKTITEQEKEKGKKVNKKRPNDFWTNIAALVIWIFFFILIAAGAVIGYQFYEESGLFFGALIGAIVGGIIVCFTMVLLEISKNNAKQVELLDDILKEINK